MDANTLQFRLTVNCDNAAFEESPEREIARILRTTAARLEQNESFDTYQNLRDLNGNVVGTAGLKTVDEHVAGRWHNRGRRGGAK